MIHNEFVYIWVQKLSPLSCRLQEQKGIFITFFEIDEYAARLGFTGKTL